MFPQLSWSYSKYMAALKREEELLRRQNQPEASFSIALGTHTRPSVLKLPHVAFLTLLLLDRLNAGKHNSEMIFGRSHG